MSATETRVLARIVPVSLFLIASLNFGFYRITGDATLYVAFVQRLFGDLPRGNAYVHGFGIGLLSAPFYAL